MFPALNPTMPSFAMWRDETAAHVQVLGQLDRANAQRLPAIAAAAGAHRLGALVLDLSACALDQGSRRVVDALVRDLQAGGTDTSVCFANAA